MQPETQANQAADQPASQPASQPAAQLDQPRPTQPRLTQLSNAQPSPRSSPGPPSRASPSAAWLCSPDQKSDHPGLMHSARPARFFPTNPGLANIVGGTDLRSDEFHSFMGFSHLRIPTFPHKGWIATRFAHWPTEAPNRKDAL